jgi:hypothetical protein
MGISMSQADKDAAKRAASGESLGAFVTLDINRLDKDELIMLGMREALDKYRRILMRRCDKWDPSKPAQRVVVTQALQPLIAMMGEELESVTLDLTQRAMRRRAGSLQEIPGVRS